MKFGKEFASQMVQEWEQAYMDYNYLKKLLKDILNSRPSNASASVLRTPAGTLRRRLSLYRAFSGLTSRYDTPRVSPGNNDDKVILVSAAQQQQDETDSHNQTMFLMSSDELGEHELVFFQRLDDELNKVLKFYKEKVNEAKTEAEELSKQMDTLIALRIRVENPMENLKNVANGNDIVALSNSEASSPNLVARARQGRSFMDSIEEVEMSSEGISRDEMRPGNTSRSHHQRSPEKGKLNVAEGFVPPKLKILEHTRINIQPRTPVSTLKNVFICSKPELSFTKEELKRAEEEMKRAFVEFHRKLRLFKSYCSLNLLAFSKIMKKHDKITSRNASKSYLEMVDRSYLGNSDEITKLTERVEATIIKHFASGNRKAGMKLLWPQAKREKDRITFFLGLFCGCTIALLAGFIISIHARNLLNSQERGQYMDNIFPLYSLFGFIILHLVLYSINIYLWRRFRINYPFIFGYKEGKQSMGYRDILLVASGLSVLTLAAVLSNLDMEMDPRTGSYKTITELVPLGLVIVVLIILFCPLNIIYRSGHFSLIICSWHCLCAPLYKVTFPDFFLADQFTSQVQAFRSLEFYICYYGWGDFKRRSNTCQTSHIYQIFYVAIAAVPFWARLLQCLRRWFEEGDSIHAFNGLRYCSTIFAIHMRTVFDLRKGFLWRIMAAASSGVATISNTYWDIVIDWGLLRRNSKNPWLRDKLLISNKIIYFAAIVINILLRLVWMQLVLGFQVPFLHGRALIAVVACLEILRRGIWNFFRSDSLAAYKIHLSKFCSLRVVTWPHFLPFRLENEHLNNVGKFRAFKSMPLPFYYHGDKST